MKTIEEKARAYDKVRKKIAIRFGSNVADEFFAEFEGSKDEEIRKALKQYFVNSFKNNGVAAICGVHVKDVLDWLEKQGEHANFRNKIQVGDKVTRNEDGVLVNLSQLKRVAKPSEKQDEKHPDPYNGISFEYNGHIWGMCARDNGVDISCDKHLIKHLEKQGEENKGNIGGISPNPNWSEEDERLIKISIACLSDFAAKGYENAVECIDRLKSIRHQNRWKPSDEQMEAIRIAAEVGTANNSWAMKILKEMYNEIRSF